MAIPNYVHLVEMCRRKYATAWANAHTGNAATDDFIRLCAAEIHAVDPNVGMNGKRGNPNDISDDALAIFAPEGTVVDRTGRRMEVIDVIASAGTAAATPAWQIVGGPSPGAWVQSGPVPPNPNPNPIPPPPPTNPVPYKPYPSDESVFEAAGRQMEADYQRAGRSGLDYASVRWTARIMQDCLMGEAPPPNGKILTLSESISKHRAEWCAALGIPVL